MTREAIEKRINELEDARFFLAMKDRWDRRDYEADDKWFKELLGLKEQLKKMA